MFSHCVVEWLGVISVLVEPEGLRELGSLGCRGSLQCVCSLQSSFCSKFLIGSEQCSCSLMFSKAFLKIFFCCGIAYWLRMVNQSMSYMMSKAGMSCCAKATDFVLSPFGVTEVKFCESVISVISWRLFFLFFFFF